MTMEDEIKAIAKCIFENNLNEQQIVKELEFLVKLAQVKRSTEFLEQLDRNFNLKNESNER
jgi:hypothetical protein